MLSKFLNAEEVMETPAPVVEAPKEETSVEEVVNVDVEAPKGEEEATEVAAAVEGQMLALLEGEVTEAPAEEVAADEAPLVEAVDGVEAL